MSKTPRVIAIILMVVGGLFVVAGSLTYYLVHRELSDEKIVVAGDAETFAGEKVCGPFTAYSQATVIKEHALDMTGGLTYAELPREDPRREAVMTASFLRSSLFTSVVAFGVSALVIGLGVLFILVGVAVQAMNKRLAQNVGVVIYESGDAVVADPLGTPPESGTGPPRASAGVTVAEARKLRFRAARAKADVDSIRRNLPQ